MLIRLEVSADKCPLVICFGALGVSTVTVVQNGADFRVTELIVDAQMLFWLANCAFGQHHFGKHSQGFSCAISAVRKAFFMPMLCRCALSHATVWKNQAVFSAVDFF